MHNSSVHLMQDVSTWGIKLEALKLVQMFVQFFSKLVGPYLPPLMAQAWQLFVGSQPVYQHLVINNAPDLDADQVLHCALLLPYLLLLVLTSSAYRRHMSRPLSRCKRASVFQHVQGPMLGVLNVSKSTALRQLTVQLVLAPRLSVASVDFDFHCCWCSKTFQACTIGMFHRLVSVQCRQMRRETIWILKA